jgi:RHS repeat-associated protein
VILLAEHDEPLLAAKKKQQHVASETATSTPKNRVWGFENYPPGQISFEPDLSAETATGSVQFSYETASGQTNYYTRDHLGSVREMLNSSGTIVSRLGYDVYGNTTVVSGTTLPTMGYAGMYWHQPSGLYLTNAGDGTSTGRPYDTKTGRWPSRDPIAEAGGINLYEYVGNDPIDKIDPTGELNPGRIPVIITTQAAGGGPEDIIVDIIDIGIILWPDSNSNCKKCKPCNPPVGTKAVARTDYPPSKPHGPIPTPHSHIVQVNQSPYPACKCFWNNANPAVVPGVSPLPPLSSFPNPPGGGGPAN